MSTQKSSGITESKEPRQNISSSSGLERSTNRRTLGEWLNIDGISYIPSTVLLTGIAKVSLKDNRLFAVLDTKGEAPRIYHAELGFYYNDTRYLSNWDMSVNGQQLVYLSHELRGQGNSCIFSMTNRDIPTLDGRGRIQRDTLLIRRVFTLYRDTVFEHIEFTNYDVIEHEIELHQTADSNFDDIFEVRGLRRAHRGQVFAPAIKDAAGSVVLEYQGLDGIMRRTFIQCLSNEPRIEATEDHIVITYRLHVPAKSRIDVKTVISFDEPSRGQLVDEPFRELTMTEHLQKIESFVGNAYLGEVRMRADNPIFDRGLRNARLDIEMLTTFEEAQGLVYPYAGIPWFSAPFGRDGLTTAYQTLPWYPLLTAGVLDYAFRTLGTTFDDFTDEEPGKIFHEMRRGEMARLKEVPYIPYFGSVDSTPLALILLGEYFGWTRDLKRLRAWWPSAKAALDWIDRAEAVYGEPPFLAYKRKAATGLENQGWKDSHNSIMYANGVLATGPIKLCEVQGYVYRARKTMAALATVLGEHEFATRLTVQADDLKKRFRTFYWDSDDRYIYLALDGDNKPCKVMSSNMGQCLWTGILDDGDAEAITQHLMSPRLFSGYGIRTLASDEKSFNPLSYHNGSVWPHDNSLIAEGFRNYNKQSQLQSLGDAIFDVMATSADFRLPELYCGFRRRAFEPPIPYEVACKPQAWAAGSVFLFLRALLGLRTSPQQDTIIFHSPLLPSRVSTLELTDVRVKNTEFSAIVYRGEKNCHIEILRRSGPMQIMVIK